MASRIAGITVEIGGDTKKLSDALKNVGKNIKQTQYDLKDVNKLLKLDPSNTTLLTQKQRLLKKAIADAEGSLKLFKETAENGDLGQEQQDELQREIVETEQRIKRMKKELKGLGSDSAVAFKAMGENLKQIGGKIKDFGSKMQDVGKELTTKVTMPLVAVGTVGAKKFADVDKVMQLTNKTMGNSADQAQLLDSAMKDAAANSTFGMSEAADATLNFARAGLSAEQAASTLAPAMNLAAGEGGNLDTVSAGLVATINGFGDEFENAATYADVFANACNNSALDIDGLSSAMSTAAPIFSSAGYSVNDAALYMGVMANAGIEASEAANALKTGFARLVSPSKSGQKALDELGISVTNADGSMKDSVTIQKELHDAFGGLSESEQIAAASAIFGKNQMSNWLALINTAPKDVDNLSDSIAKSGTTTEMAGAMMSGFGGSMEKLKSSIDVAMTSIGEAIAPVIMAVAEKIQALVDWFNGLSEGTQRLIVIIGAIVAAVGPLIAIIGTVIMAIGGIVTAIGSIVAAGPVVATVIGVITAVGVALGAIIGVGVAVAKNWDNIKNAAQKLYLQAWASFNSLKVKTIATINNLKTKLSEIWDKIKTTITTKATELKDKAIEKIKQMKEKIGETAKGIKDKLYKPFKEGKEKIEGVVKTIKRKLESIKDFKWLKVPSLSVKGGSAPWGIGGKGKKPSFSISWNKKAEVNPYMFSTPTFFAAGERNDEMLYGKKALMNDIMEAQRLGGAGQSINVTVNGARYQDPNELAHTISRIIANEQRKVANAW